MSTPINASESEADSDGTTSLDVATPSGTTSGDLLLVLVTVDDAIVTTSMTGFTELYQEVSETFVVGSAYYRVSDGTEGANLTITLSSSEQVCARAVRITDFSGTPFFEVSSIGNSTTQTPPPITPSGGSSDYLYLVHDHIDTNNATISSFPSGYTNTGDVISTRTRLAWGEKATLATTSETPGDFTISSTRRAVVSTIAIASVASGSTITPNAINNLQSISNVTLTQSNILSVDGISSAQAISEPNISTDSELLVNPITNTQTISQPTFTQANILSVNNLTTVNTISEAALVVAGALGVNNISSSQSISLVAFMQQHLLSVDNISNINSITESTIDTGLNLIVDSISSAQSITEAGLTQHNIILVDPITNTQFIGVVSLGGEGQDIGTVTASFKEDDISVEYGVINITVKFKE